MHGLGKAKRTEPSKVLTARRSTLARSANHWLDEATPRFASEPDQTRRWTAAPRRVRDAAAGAVERRAATLGLGRIWYSET